MRASTSANRLDTDEGTEEQNVEVRQPHEADEPDAGAKCGDREWPRSLPDRERQAQDERDQEERVTVAEGDVVGGIVDDGGAEGDRERGHDHGAAAEPAP